MGKQDRLATTWLAEDTNEHGKRDSMNKICGECAHYRHGDIETPCEIGNKYCGYLVQGKPCWEAEEGDIDQDAITKVCAKCGQARSLSDFYKSRLSEDKLSAVCKICKPSAWISRKKK